VKRLLGTDHFPVDGTLVEAWDPFAYALAHAIACVPGRCGCRIADERRRESFPISLCEGL
jgi:hypothetical protein